MPSPTLPLNDAGFRDAPAFAVYDVESLTTSPPLRVGQVVRYRGS